MGTVNGREQVMDCLKAQPDGPEAVVVGRNAPIEGVVHLVDSPVPVFHGKLLFTFYPLLRFYFQELVFFEAYFTQMANLSKRMEYQAMYQVRDECESNCFRKGEQLEGCNNECTEEKQSGDVVE
mmetsp:Transcript_9572/g.13178  ORF Transcript_9572/g.13178 Transcript_9572/m.13178 type:complete len:124 (-) Transcript_9572:7-378(-)